VGIRIWLKPKMDDMGAALFSKKYKNVYSDLEFYNIVEVHSKTGNEPTRRN
jgi:hypothetical protein